MVKHLLGKSRTGLHRTHVEGRDQNCFRLSDQVVCESKRRDVAAIEICLKSPYSHRTEPSPGNVAVNHALQYNIFYNNISV
jgi:hypothetical protein